MDRQRRRIGVGGRRRRSAFSSSAPRSPSRNARRGGSIAVTTPAVQWNAKVRGSLDLEAFCAHAGPGLTLLFAPASFASSASDLARAVAAHPESFKPANVL